MAFPPQNLFYLTGEEMAKYARVPHVDIVYFRNYLPILGKVG